MLRRRAALSIRMNALISLKPSESEMKSLISAIDNALPLEPCGADGFGAPSKKNATCCNRLAPMDMLGAPLSASALGGIRLQSDRLDGRISFSGLLTGVEIGHMRISSAG